MANTCSRTRIRVLREVETFGGLAVACVLIAAIELAIEWNGISGVKDMTTAAQLIPVGIVVALILVFLYDLKNGRPAQGSSSGSSGSSSGGPTCSSGSGGSGGGSSGRRSHRNGGIGSRSGLSSSGPPSSGGWSGYVR